MDIDLVKFFLIPHYVGSLLLLHKISFREKEKNVKNRDLVEFFLAPCLDHNGSVTAVRLPYLWITFSTTIRSIKLWIGLVPPTLSLQTLEVEIPRFDWGE